MPEAVQLAQLRTDVGGERAEGGVGGGLRGQWQLVDVQPDVVAGRLPARAEIEREHEVVVAVAVQERPQGRDDELEPGDAQLLGRLHQPGPHRAVEREPGVPALARRQARPPRAGQHDLALVPPPGRPEVPRPLPVGLDPRPLDLGMRTVRAAEPRRDLGVRAVQGGEVVDEYVLGAAVEDQVVGDEQQHVPLGGQGEEREPGQRSPFRLELPRDLPPDELVQRRRRLDGFVQ